MIGLLVVLFAGLVAGSFGQDQLSQHAPGVAGNSVAALLLSVTASSASLTFIFVTYYLLTNVPHTPRDVLPGALAATLVLALSFQVPLYLDLAQGSPALQAFGGPLILLVWLYLMANVIVLGAELNWWIARRRARLAEGLSGLAWLHPEICRFPGDGWSPSGRSGPRPPCRSRPRSEHRDYQGFSQGAAIRGTSQCLA